MRKILFLLLLSLFIPTLCYGAAMSAAITWEFNAASLANNAGSGGFKTGATGTDYSKATTYHWTQTDLSCASTSTNIVSLNSTFDATAVGNVIHITAITGVGTLVGWYEITAYVDSHTLTLNTSPAPGAGAGTLGTFYIGGALSLNSTLDDEFFDQLVAGQKVYFLKGSYTLGEAVSAAANGTTTLPIYMTGYTSNRDDTTTGLNRPSIACGANIFTTGTYWWVRNFSFTGTAASIFTLGSGVGSYGLVKNCKFINSTNSTNKVGLTPGQYSLIYNNEASSPAGYGMASGSGSEFFYGNYCHHSTIGLYVNYGNITIENNIFSNNVTSGITFANNIYLISNNTFYGSESKIGTGIILGTGYNTLFLNNIIYGFITGITATASSFSPYIDYNDLYNNTTPTSNVTELSNDVALDPTFTNAAGTLIDNCETQWSYADGDVTLTADPTVYKVGTKSMKAVCAANLGAGDIACAQTITSTNMSTYNGFGIWVQSTVTLAAGDWQFVIDDTANCASPIGTFNLPAMTGGTWYWLYLDGLDMSSYTAIISIGFKQIVDKGAMTLYCDDLRATDNDFTIGTNLKAKGFPGVFNGGHTTGYLDIGAVQRVEPSGTTNDVLGVLD